MSKSSRDVGKTKKLKQTTMGKFFSTPATSSKKKHKNSKSKMTFWGSSSGRDTEDYRERYPDKKDDEDLDANVRFYKNEIESKPDGALIEVMLKDWWGDYKLLEKHHGYIQWLFPIREDGMNWHAQELQKHEIAKICEDKEAHARVLKAYKMMLNFYGMKLEDDESGKIERAENWEDRFKHLNKSFHNYLRITRILKCLGELEYEQLKKPFIEFILYEAMVEKTLPNLLNSCYNYWINVLRDDNERLDMWNLYSQYEQTFESSDEENKKKPKMNNESENGVQSADLKASENENGTAVEPKQEDDIKQLSPLDKSDVLMEVDSDRNESKVTENGKGQEDNTEESTQVSDPGARNQTDNGNKESCKIMTNESENNNESANFHASSDEKVKKQEGSIQEVHMEESPNVLDAEALVKTGNEKIESSKMLKVESEDNDKSANSNASVDDNKVNEQKVLSKEDNTEKLTQLDDSLVLSESESVEMTDDSQRLTYDQEEQIDSETPVTRDEQQAGLSKKDSVMHDNHSNQEQNREEYQENSCEDKLEANMDMKANGKLEKVSSSIGNIAEASDVVKKA
ncbi:hypothetical protein ACJMK2_020467 [Sinanodonta woodiana]|uniref:Opioid growth factor receptor (OGFr) conserved domain-containing protein n=2 Tax=Sinanodonta woodiana TaxID=1069815 RepID=A0ABD3TXK1_SINWO